MTTSLVFEGYRFGHVSPLADFSFPALRALALINCDYVLLQNLTASQFPKLKTLMVKDCPLVMSLGVEPFIQNLVGLLEHVLHGQDAMMVDEATIFRHASTLEILSVRRKQTSVERPAFMRTTQDLRTMLRSLTAIRHLSYFIGGNVMICLQGNLVWPSEELQAALEILTPFEHLQTLHLLCEAVLFSYKSKITSQDIRRLSECHMFEAVVAGEAMQLITHGPSALAGEHSMEYLSLTANFIVPSSMSAGDLQQAISETQQATKHILSLKPSTVCGLAAQLKEDMITRYENDGY
ncbi:hypothetical protein CC86DRAFT_49239 [Ophiobolus disseminans]|uniref:F-box domain-containing protein n=1 Tax=Ophiobolus disseminans TaxID=1469910 RepID=A0A6A6ZVU0_9PLEO|nr:hypothetical protein CC86DRAFT_49239 [Ophiobolus disseminans]